MNKENKVISLELAKKIHDKAKEKGFELPESEYMWFNLANKEEKDKGIEKWEVMNIHDVEMLGEYPAYDIAELREMIGKKMLETYMNAGKVSVAIYGHPQVFDEDTFAEAMGKMFYYLLKNDLL